MSHYKKFSEELVSKGIDGAIVKQLMKEYEIVKKEHLLGDDEKVILHSAKFSDLVLALIKNIETGIVVDIDNIHFNKLQEEVLKYPKKTAKQVILTLAIPRVAVSVYTIRSKKNVAHIKTVNPSFIDSLYCVSACDWMLSEIAMLFYTSNPNETRELIDSFLKKKMPVIEEFEDKTLVILKKDLPLYQEILLILYYHYPERLLNSEIFKALKSTNVYSKLKWLENKRLIHRTRNGNKLTRLGIEFVENLIPLFDTISP